MTLVRTLFAALLIAAPASAQDLIGFELDSFGKTVLSRKQFAGDAIPEAAFGAYNNEFISAYSSQSVFARMGRSVGRLDVATDKGVFPCTAFLVEDDLLMTNNHCVPGILENPRADASSIVGVRFVMGYTREGVTEGTTSFLVDPVPVETSKPLDYTLLRVLGDAPGKAFGTLKLAAVTPLDNDPYWIIGHPMGEAQRISREKCRANAPALSDNKLLHTCDTMPGNSGSPVIDAGSRRVVGLHHAGSANNSVNYAIPMAAILAASAILSPAGDEDTGRDDPETIALAQLSEALQIDDDADRKAALEALVADAGTTSAGRTAARLLAALQPAPPPPAPEPTLAERMAADANVQACDRLAGDQYHPDRKTGLMRAPGLLFDDIEPEPAISACLSALETFPDHPRMTGFLAEALSAAERYEEAFATYRTAAVAGDPIGQTGLGIAYLWGLGTETDYALAREWMEKAAAQGHPIAITGLAVVYDRGRGVPEDPDRAIALYTQGAEAGYYGAQDTLGDMYLEGRLVEQSNSSAAFWYEKAAAQGNAPSQYQLGRLYEQGLGVTQSFETAARWYTTAADQGHTDAQISLASLYFQGRGVERSEAEAVRLLRIAAEKNNPFALFSLGWLTETGRGVTKDPEEAARLYVAALRAGSEWPIDRETGEWPRETARALQQALAAEGVYKGATDGRIGKLTQDAMRSLLP